MASAGSSGPASSLTHEPNSMPTIPLAAISQVFALVLLLGCAVVMDLRSRRIPNRLVLAGLVLAVLRHAVLRAAGQPSLSGAAWWSPLAGLLAGGAALLPLYLAGATGAGDVKLLAMVGAFTGAATALTVVLYTLLAGGVLGLLWMPLCGVTAHTLRNVRYLANDWLLRAQTGGGMRLAPLEATAARLPYAVAIACGTVGALCWPLFGR